MSTQTQTTIATITSNMDSSPLTPFTPFAQLTPFSFDDTFDIDDLLEPIEPLEQQEQKEPKKKTVTDHLSELHRMVLTMIEEHPEIKLSTITRQVEGAWLIVRPQDRRSPNPFHEFIKTNMKRVRIDNPHLKSHGERMKLIGQMWSERKRQRP